MTWKVSSTSLGNLRQLWRKKTIEKLHAYVPCRFSRFSPPSASAIPCYAAQRLGLVGWNAISPSGGNTSQRGGSTTGGSAGRDSSFCRFLSSISSWIPMDSNGFQWVPMTLKQHSTSRTRSSNVGHTPNQFKSIQMPNH